ncbi:MAG: hypothetical protein M3R60_06905 [Pseudomonadota bacterium]|nr:hypothetical protein [Pseudomonadota bacterium]
MDTLAPSADSTSVDEFRNAHTIWREANDSFHDRFREIITAGRSSELDTLAADLSGKFDHFIQCSKAFVAAHVPE